MPGVQSALWLYLFLSVLLCAFLPVVRPCEDFIYADGATGSGVVEAVVDRVRTAGIFDDSEDHCLLRRIAFVETCDGDDHLSPGGIWALNETFFNITIQDPDNKLEDYFTSTEIKFPCTNGALRYENMKKPLISGLMARMYLEHLNQNIKKIPADVEGQADFWFRYYYSHRGNLRKEDFIRLVRGSGSQESEDNRKKREENVPEEESVDLTLENANGSDVVNAVIAKLDASGIFGPDHHFLRRLAYVESRDGADLSTLSKSDNTGIWCLERCKFHFLQRVIQNQTNQNASVDEEMANITRHIELHFHFNILDLTIGFLEKPLFSGIIARLYLYYVTVAKHEQIPLAGEIEEQGKFWIKYYHPDTRGVTATHFIDKVSTLEKEEGCLVNADIFFVLDVSGSVGGHLPKATAFVYDFVETLTIIGPKHNQVGAILFNTTAQTLFKLNAHDNKDDLLAAINGTQNLIARGSTNIIDGLCKLIGGYKEENGARPPSSAIFRVVIMLSDGRSNEHKTLCNLSSITAEAASEVRELISPILVYVIGVTNSVNEKELRSIATPGFYTHIDKFNKRLLKDAQEEHTESVCRRASLALNFTEEVNGTLSENEIFRYNLQIPYIGITVRVCVLDGRVQVYGSLLVTNPNSALHDFYLDIEGNGTDGELCENKFIPGCSIPASSCFQNQNQTTRAKRQLQQSPTSHQQNNVVYLSIVGKAAVNNFALISTEGNSEPHSNTPRNPQPNGKGNTTEEGTATTEPGSTPVSRENRNVIGIVLGSCFAALLLVVSIVIIGCVYHGCVVHRLKKKRKMDEQYHKKLLDMKQVADYNEYDIS